MHDLREAINALIKTLLFSIIVFNMNKFLATLQVKAGKTMIKRSCRGLAWSGFFVRHYLSSFILFSSGSITTSGMNQLRWKYDLFPWLKWGFILVNATSRNNKYTDLCQYCLTVSEGMLFWLIYCPQCHGSFISNFLAKLIPSAFTDWNCYQSCQVLPHIYGLFPQFS